MATIALWWKEPGRTCGKPMILRRLLEDLHPQNNPILTDRIRDFLKFPLFKEIRMADMVYPVPNTGHRVLVLFALKTNNVIMQARVNT